MPSRNALNPDFRRLWIAQAMSKGGTQVTLIAIPLLAALTLDASPLQMGLLGASASLARVLFSLVARVWVDRLPRRPVLIGTDLARAAVVSAVPVAWMLDLLRLEMLYVIEFVVASLSVFFDVAYRSYLPTLVDRDDLLGANSRLEATSSAAHMAGPGAAGMLIAAAGAPLALVLDAVSYLISAIFVSRIQVREFFDRTTVGTSMAGEIRDGISIVFAQPVLRAITGCTATWAFFDSVTLAVLVLFITRTLNLGAAAVGVVFSSMGVGLFLGALMANRMSRRFGIGPACIGGAGVSGMGGGIAALAGGPSTVALGVLMLAMFLLGLGGTIYVINDMTVRQASVDPRYHGRMNATITFATSTLGPLGFLAGGALGEWLGLRAALIVGALGGTVAFLWLLSLPLRGMRVLSPWSADGEVDVVQPPGHARV